MAVSVGLHLLIAVALVSFWKAPTEPAERPPIIVALLPPQRPQPADPAPEISPAPAATTPPLRDRLRPTPVPPEVEPLPAAVHPTPQPELGLSDAEVAGAAGAGDGAGGGECDMARTLQAALRKDPLVLAAVAPGRPGAAPSGKMLRVWNGDWLSHPGQDGKGLAAVREAVMWEIAFAPPACREVRVSGLVVLSLADAPQAPRLALGAGAWRWSDLIAPTPGFREPRALRCPNVGTALAAPPPEVGSGEDDDHDATVLRAARAAGVGRDRVFLTV